LLGVGGVSRQFYVGYGTLAETLFSLGHRAVPLKEVNDHKFEEKFICV